MLSNWKYIGFNEHTKTQFNLAIQILNIFKLQQLLEKDQILFGKLWTNIESGLRTKILFCIFFCNEFCKRFKRNLTVDPSQTVLLSRDIIVIDKEKLICEPTYDEILKVVNQIRLLRAPVPDGMHVIFYQKCWNILDRNSCGMIKAFKV